MSRLLEKSKIVSSTETPKETESIDKGKTNDEGGEDMRWLPPKTGRHLDAGNHKKAQFTEVEDGEAAPQIRGV